MTKHPRLQPIGQRDPHLERLAKYQADFLMADDALRSLPFAALLEVVEAAIEARPDIDAGKLEAFANRMGRRAHMEGRNNA